MINRRRGWTDCIYAAPIKWSSTRTLMISILLPMISIQIIKENMAAQVDFYLSLNAFLSPELFDAGKLAHICPIKASPTYFVNWRIWKWECFIKLSNGGGENLIGLMLELVWVYTDNCVRLRNVSSTIYSRVFISLLRKLLAERRATLWPPNFRRPVPPSEILAMSGFTC